MNKNEYLLDITNNTMNLWKNTIGFAPSSVTQKLSNTMLDWNTELTKTLLEWNKKGLDLELGELILARANLGAVAEFWLRFFYIVYYEDYTNAPLFHKNNLIEPEDVRFYNLIEFSTGVLWDNTNDPTYKWLHSVRKKRNAIHSIEYRDIGTPADFINDFVYLSNFVEDIINRLPPIEDYYN